MISDVPAARKVLAGMRGMLERAEALPWEVSGLGFVCSRRAGGVIVDNNNDFTTNALIAAAVNGWPVLIAHAKDVLDRHVEVMRRGDAGTHPTYECCEWCSAPPFMFMNTPAPCHDVRSVFALLGPYESLGEGGKP